MLLKYQYVGICSYLTRNEKDQMENGCEGECDQFRLLISVGDLNAIIEPICWTSWASHMFNPTVPFLVSTLNSENTIQPSFKVTYMTWLSRSPAPANSLHLIVC